MTQRDPGLRAEEKDLQGRVLAGEPRALGKAISTLLANGVAGRSLASFLRRHTGHAHRVGVTGSPGVGKSTLVAALARDMLERGERVGVVASDPASPYSGGAFLGDRVRLAGFRLATDPRIFFRSLACRQSGGVAEEASRVADVLDAAGYPWVFLETVGAGQSETGVRALAPTVVVVLSASLGDDVQLLKAGILEIADIFVVNRSDKPGSDKLCRSLEERVHSRDKEAAWEPPVVPTEAIRGEGIANLLEALRKHRDWLLAKR